ncbi:MAG: hypothetical protein SOW08_01755, partial [Lachnospiraceae bacterium]|nr:hypothetical protein [Lachnospiraceae bacterium]
SFGCFVFGDSIIPKVGAFFMSRHQFNTDFCLSNQAFIPALPVGKLSYIKLRTASGTSAAKCQT